MPDTSAYRRSVHGEAARWTATEHLLASTVDALHGANWQRGGGKGQRPKPVVRPGEDSKGKTGDGRTFGTASLSIGEAEAFFARINRDTPPDVPSCAWDGCDRTGIKARGYCARCYQRWRRAS